MKWTEQGLCQGSSKGGKWTDDKGNGKAGAAHAPLAPSIMQ